jgi:hypothetical protein
MAPSNAKKMLIGRSPSPRLKHGSRILVRGDQVEAPPLSDGKPEQFDIDRTNRSKAVKHFADRINVGWRRTLDAILHVATACAEADEVLNADSKRELYGQLQFARSTFNKFCRIGRNTNFQNPNVKILCPPSWTILADLSKWDTVDFAAAVSQQILKPTARRMDLKDWHRQNRTSLHALGANSSLAAHTNISSKSPDLSETVDLIDTVPLDIANGRPDGVHFEQLVKGWNDSPDLARLWQSASPVVRSRFLQTVLEWQY